MERAKTRAGGTSDLIVELGTLAFASRLRRLHERLVKDVGRVYAGLGFRFQPRWFLAVYRLHTAGHQGVTELASCLSLSHAAINQMAAELTQAGWMVKSRQRGDDRKRMLGLTRRGKALAVRLEPVWEEIRQATLELFKEAGADPLRHLAAVEGALDKQSVYNRVRRVRGESLEPPLEIVDYRPRFKKYFDALNRAWLEEYFTVEPEDDRLLADPKGKIINRGGAVLFAKLGDRIVGTCALIRHDPREFELAKMAVDPSARRQGIGRELAEAVIDRARRAGGKRLFLLTSEKLKAALELYRNTGFRSAPLPRELAAKYKRCTVAMDLELGSSARPRKRRTQNG